MDDPVGAQDPLVGDVGRRGTVATQQCEGLARWRIARIELVAQPQPLGERREGGRRRRRPGAFDRAQTDIRTVTEDLAREGLVAEHRHTS